MTNMEQPIQITGQLREACKDSGARWAVWVFPSPSGWSFEHASGLSKPRLAVLQELTSSPKTNTWLGGALTSGRVRQSQTGTSAAGLGCRRIYAFPNNRSHAALLVGADQLDRSGESLFRVLAVLPPPPPDQALERKELPYQLRLPFESGRESSYDLEGVLQTVLEFLAGLAPCEAALLSVRSGDVFRVEAVWNCPKGLRGRLIPLYDNPLISDLVSRQEGVVIADLEAAPQESANLGLHGLGRAWMGAPVVIGKRVIGHLEFSASKPGVFQGDDLRRAVAQAKQLAYVVENAIVFSEATRYLRQLALLNELVSTASLGSNTDEIARRISARLRRTFGAGQARIFLESAAGSCLREYGAAGARRELPSQAGSLVRRVMETGLPLRVLLPEEGPAGLSAVSSRDTAQAGAALAVPLKYRGKAIGAMIVHKKEPDPFSPQDEQLLVLIAGQMAGLFENMRLSDETSERARNLGLIHRVVQDVIGLTDVAGIASTSAKLMVKDFDDEAAVILLQEDGLAAWTAGPGSRSSTFTPDAAEASEYFPLAGLVLADGASRLNLDLAPGAFSFLAPGSGGGGWKAAAEMCVPLRDGERIFGVLGVVSSQPGVFTESDLLALEALSGVMSSVILSARRYGQLQDSYRQLQAVRESAIDLAADLDLDVLLRRVIHRARELVGAQAAELGLLDEKEGVVRILVTDSPWGDSAGQKIPLLAGVSGRVAAFGEPLVIGDYNRWSGRLNPDQAAPFRTVAGVPLKFRGQVIGTLTLMDSRPGWAFTPEHIHLLELLAPQATVWIRNARLYQELEERIQAQHAAEMRLVRSARLAAVGEMAAGVAHELNNPLTTVIGFTELVIEELAAGSSHREDLELVLREALRAREVVRRLLDFSRPQEYQRMSTDLNELVTDVVALVRHLARTSGVDVSLVLANDLPWAPVDPGHIKQVLLNLLHNAIQAMPTGGKLGVATTSVDRDSQTWLSVSVRDTGVGISPQNLERIFEPFFTTRPQGTGTGLGLSVSYGIVKEHGGFIEVDSQPGEGSCFTIFLPSAGGEKNG